MPPIDADRDWAIVRLEAPACSSGGLPLSTRSRGAIETAADRGDIYQAAVHSDLADTGLQKGAPCALPSTFPSAAPDALARDFSNPGAILFHTCDTGGGSSGSPLLIDGPDGPEVVGINVGTYVFSSIAASAEVATGTLSHQTNSEPIANTAIVTAQFADAVAALSARDSLDRRQEVRRLQTLLHDRGWFDAPVDGRLSPALVTAIERYEVSAGRLPTGLMQRALLRELEAQANPPASPAAGVQPANAE